MGVVVKEAKQKIIQLMLQGYTVEKIAKKTNYSVWTIRSVFEELRAEYRVKSKIGIAKAYLSQELVKIRQDLQNILNLFPAS